MTVFESLEHFCMWRHLCMGKKSLCAIVSSEIPDLYGIDLLVNIEANIFVSAYIFWCIFFSWDEMNVEETIHMKQNFEFPNTNITLKTVYLCIGMICNMQKTLQTGCSTRINMCPSLPWHIEPTRNSKRKKSARKKFQSRFIWSCSDQPI